MTIHPTEFIPAMIEAWERAAREDATCNIGGCCAGTMATQAIRRLSTDSILQDFAGIMAQIGEEAEGPMIDIIVNASSRVSDDIPKDKYSLSALIEFVALFIDDKAGIPLYTHPNWQHGGVFVAAILLAHRHPEFVAGFMRDVEDLTDEFMDRFYANVLLIDEEGAVYND